MDHWEVPASETMAYREKQHRHALVIPVLNEDERIRNQLGRIAALSPAVDVIIADGGSTDGSLDPDYIKSIPVRAVLVKTGPGKLSAQLRMAYAWVLRDGYDGIVTIDGNGKDGVDAITRFVEKLESGYDYIQGSRYRKGGTAVNNPFERTIGNRMIHAPLLSLAGRRCYSDTTNGFRAYSRRYLLDPRVAPFREVFCEYELLFYLTVRAGQLGYRTCEVAVTRSYPDTGPLPTKIRTMGAKANILSQTWKAATGAFHP